MKKIYIIHTSLVSHVELGQLFADIIPEAKLFNIIDDSLLHDVMAAGHVTPKIISRMCDYFQAAEKNGADLIFNQCSSVGFAADIASKTVSVPVLKIDEAMAEQAVAIGGKIAVVATVASTVDPSSSLVRSKAEAAGKTDVVVKEYLVDGALDILMKEKDRAKHNRLVIEQIKIAEQECDVIVLAQGSMTAILDELGDIKKPVFTSPKLGVTKARDILAQG